MDRRKFMEAGTALSLGAFAGAVAPERGASAPLPLPAPLAFRDEPSKLKITGVRMVRPRPAKPLPAYEPAAGSWSTGGALVKPPIASTARGGRALKNCCARRYERTQPPANDTKFRF